MTLEVDELMKKYSIIGALIVTASAALALKITRWDSLDTYESRSSEFVIADCVEPHITNDDTWIIARVDVVDVWKGNRAVGPLDVAVPAWRPLIRGQRYLMANMGGTVAGTIDFLAHHELYAVPLPRSFPIDQYKTNSLSERLAAALQTRLTTITNQVRSLDEEAEAIQRMMK